eukprot:scaffold75206_cov12-Tisochrysis_lutea.AAC.1
MAVGPSCGVPAAGRAADGCDEGNAGTLRESCPGDPTKSMAVEPSCGVPAAGGAAGNCVEVNAGTSKSGHTVVKECAEAVGECSRLPVCAEAVCACSKGLLGGWEWVQLCEGSRVAE